MIRVRKCHCQLTKVRKLCPVLYLYNKNTLFMLLTLVSRQKKKNWKQHPEILSLPLQYINKSVWASTFSWWTTVSIFDILQTNSSHNIFPICLNEITSELEMKSESIVSLQGLHWNYSFINRFRILTISNSAQ